MRARLALLVVVVGCGDDAGALPDAPIDATTDTPIDTSSELLVTLTITDGGVPAVGATVYFQNPDSSLVVAATTDLDGTATAALPEGGFVTAIEPRPLPFGGIVIRDRLATFAGVKPGDELHLDVGPPANLTTILFDVQVPADPGASTYELYMACGRARLGTEAATAPQQVSLVGCAGIEDMIVVSADPATQPLRAMYRPGQAVADGATVTLTEPYADLVPITVTLTGSPAWVGSYAVEVDVTSTRGRLFPAFVTIDPAAPVGMLALPVAAGTTAVLRADLYATLPGVAQQSILAWGLPIGDHALDAGAATLRPITSLPVFDPATRTMTWTDEPGLSPDVVRAEVYTYRDGAPAHAWSWELVAPAGNGPVLTYPILPGDAATAFQTRATDSFSVPKLETLAIAGGYDRIRPHALGRRFDVVPPGPAGQLTSQQLSEATLLVTPTLRRPAPFTRATR